MRWPAAGRASGDLIEQAGDVSNQAHDFIYSRKGMTASQVLEPKRSRWGIENQLHWVLDMQLREDESRAGTGNSAENLNVIRHGPITFGKRISWATHAHGAGRRSPQNGTLSNFSPNVSCRLKGVLPTGGGAAFGA